ncbi:MAG: hypothetical protein EWV75_22065 [Microcystis wesenbergii Mw_QC_S_20081001_S30D]|uniref:Protein kinase domain-containing protein n=1 Tax=Microcystis wesenbergii Mw_QC_S_20081001_S30D TaxID=2486245 RepID=A0A552J7L8_9CHRO|nr:MAG: hypothetical protein EWV75_22065 [Microcystis wesenbergii Mw_QC_S_20081001_S30D]TRV02948.1 MAG: hypothetical protein EWV74_07770 [Microcystis wesenbergii Mw_QC_S_20081001_S30]TRV04744.1 MAG: hypothetical protein EWV73_02185 [Microcystis wesenbergii Mw_QC_B_20070930_S4D]TRV16932.1 MAG: hypothetical protein EWV89_03895 [Microcystis wesenbergii Mw_QC_B_20070930_S4]
MPPYLKPINDNPQVHNLVKERFEREAAILEKLSENSPQIPKLYAYFEENNQFYLVEEFIEGETLSQRIQSKGRAWLFSFPCGREKNRDNFPKIQYSKPCLARLSRMISTDYHTESRRANFFCSVQRGFRYYRFTIKYMIRILVLPRNHSKYLIF